MVASKRVPAAYRKHNRVSHLTADAVHRLGFRLDDSGKKLTVGQMRNQRQRGGTGDDDPQAPQPPTLSHWATSIAKKRREAYLQQYLGTSDVKKGADGHKQMEAAAKVALGADDALHTEMFNHFHEFHQARVDDSTNRTTAVSANSKKKGAAVAAYLDYVASQAESPPEALPESEPQPQPASARLQQLESQAPPAGATPQPPPELLQDPHVQASHETKVQSALHARSLLDSYVKRATKGKYGDMFTIARKDPKWWCAGPTDPNPRVKLCQDAAQEYISNTPASEGWGGFREIEEFATAALPGYLIEFLQSDDKAAEAEQNVSEWMFSQGGADSSLRKLYADHQSFIDTGIDDARGQPTTDTRLVFEQVIGATPNTVSSVAPAATPDHVQDDHDTGSAATQWSISADGGSPYVSPAQQLNFSGVSQQAAAIGAARDSAGDPETLAAIGRLSTAAENARTEVDYQQIPAVSQLLDSDPELSDLVRRGLVNPRRLSDPLYATRIRQQLTRRESGVVAADGTKQYSTATSRPNTLQRGRIARSKAPVFERVGNVPSRRNPGLKYYRRAAATRPGIFSVA